MSFSTRVPRAISSMTEDSRETLLCAKVGMKSACFCAIYAGCGAMASKVFQGLQTSFMNEPSSAHLNPFRAMPNLLTLARICLAPFLVAAIVEDRYLLGFLLFVAAGLTDAFDGALARILKQRTMFGQYLDPVADKLLLSTLFVALTQKGLIPARVTILVFGRDLAILVVAAILYAAAGRREFRPSLFGKANTVAQVTAVAVVLLHQIEAAPWVVMLRSVALEATIALTVASGLHYAWLVTRRTGGSVPNGASNHGPSSSGS